MRGHDACSTRRVRLLLLSSFAIVLGACVADAEITDSGPGSTPQQQTASCGESATLERDASGSGPLSVEVVDGTGHSVFDATTEGALDDTRTLGGNAGTWRLDVNAERFTGSIDITLSCNL